MFQASHAYARGVIAENSASQDTAGRIARLYQPVYVAFQFTVPEVQV